MENVTIETTAKPAADAPPAAKTKSKKASVKGGKSAKTAKATKKLAKKPKPAKPTAAKAATERSNKKAEVIALMKRAKGETLDEIVAATDWQKHTARGFVSILGKNGGETIF